MSGYKNKEVKDFAKKLLSKLYAEMKEEITVRLNPLKNLGVRNKEEQKQLQTYLNELDELQKEQDEIIDLFASVTSTSMPIDMNDVNKALDDANPIEDFEYIKKYVRDFNGNIEKLPDFEKYQRKMEDFILRQAVARYENGRGNLPDAYAYNINRENSELYKALSEVPDHKTRINMINLLSGNIGRSYKGTDAAIAAEAEKYSNIAENEKQIAALNVISKCNKHDKDVQLRLWSAKYDAIRHHKSSKTDYEEFLKEQSLADNGLYNILKDGPDINIPNFFNSIMSKDGEGLNPYDKNLERELLDAGAPVEFVRGVLKTELTKEPLDPLAVEVSKFYSKLPGFSGISKDKSSADEICISLVAKKDSFFNTLSEGLTKNGEKKFVDIFTALNVQYKDAEDDYDVFRKIPETLQIIKNFVKDTKNYTEQRVKLTQENEPEFEQEFLYKFCVDSRMKQVVDLGTDLAGNNKTKALTDIFSEENKLFLWAKALDDIKAEIDRRKKDKAVLEELEQLMPQKGKTFGELYSAADSYIRKYPQYCADLPKALEDLWEQYPEGRKDPKEQYSFTSLKYIADFHEGLNQAKEDIFTMLDDDKLKESIEKKLSADKSFGQMYNNIAEMLKAYPQECSSLPQLLKNFHTQLPDDKKLNIGSYDFSPEAMSAKKIFAEYIPEPDPQLPYYGLYSIEAEIVQALDDAALRKEVQKLMPSEGDSFADIYTNVCKLIRKHPDLCTKLPDAVKKLWEKLPEEEKLDAENYSFNLGEMSRRNILQEDILRPDANRPDYQLYSAEIEILKTLTDDNIRNTVRALMPKEDESFGDIYDKTCSLIQMYPNLCKKLPSALKTSWGKFPVGKKGNFASYKFELEEIKEAGNIAERIEEIDKAKPYYALHEAERNIFNKLGIEFTDVKKHIKSGIPKDGESFGDIYNAACDLIKKYPDNADLFKDIPAALEMSWKAFPDDQKAPIENYDLTLEGMSDRDTSYELLVEDKDAPYSELFRVEYEIMKSVGDPAVREKIRGRMPKEGQPFDEIYYNTSIIISDNEQYCGRIPQALKNIWKNFTDDKKQRLENYKFGIEELKDYYSQNEKFPDMAKDAPAYELYKFEQDVYHRIKDAELRETIKNSMPKESESFDQIYEKTCTLIRTDRNIFKDLPGMLRKAWARFSYEHKAELETYDFSSDGIANYINAEQKAPQLDEFTQFENHIRDHRPEKYEDLLLEYVVNARRYFDGQKRSREELKDDILHGRDVVYNALYAASSASPQLQENVIGQLRDIREKEEAVKFFDDIEFIAGIAKGEYSGSFSAIERMGKSLFAGKISDSLPTKLKGIYSDGTQEDPDFVNCNKKISSIDLIKANNENPNRNLSDEEIAIVTQASFIAMISNPAAAEYHRDLTENEQIREDLKARFALEANRELNPNIPDDMFTVFAENMIQNDSSRSNNLLRMVIPKVRADVKRKIKNEMVGGAFAFTDEVFFTVQKCCDYISSSKKFTPGVFAAAKIVSDTMPLVNRIVQYSRRFSNGQLDYIKHVCNLYKTMKEVSDLEKQLSDQLIKGQLGQGSKEEIKASIADINARKCYIDEYLQNYSFSNYQRSGKVPFDTAKLVANKYRNEYIEYLKTTETFTKYGKSEDIVGEQRSMSGIADAFISAQKNKVEHKVIEPPAEASDITKDLNAIIDSLEGSLTEYSDVVYVQSVLHAVRQWNNLGKGRFDRENLDRYLEVMNAMKDMFSDAGGASALWANLRQEIARREGGVRQSRYKKETIVLDANEWSNTDVQVSRIKDDIKRNAVKSLNRLIEKVEASRPHVEKETDDLVGILKLTGHPQSGDYDTLIRESRRQGNEFAYYVNNWMRQPVNQGKPDYSYNRPAPVFDPYAPAENEADPNFNELDIIKSDELFSGVSKSSSFAKNGIKSLSDMNKMYPDVLVLIENDRKAEKKKPEQKDDPKPGQKDELNNAPDGKKKEDKKQEVNEEKPDVETLKNRLLGVAYTLERQAAKRMLGAEGGAQQSDPYSSLMFAAASLCREYAELADEESAAEMIAGRVTDENGKPNLEFAILHYALDFYNGKIEAARDVNNEKLLKTAVRYSQDTMEGITDKNVEYKFLYNKLKKTTYLFDSDRRKVEKEAFKQKFKDLKTSIAVYQKYWSLPMRNLAALYIDEISVAATKLLDTSQTFNDFVSGVKRGQVRDLTIASRAMSHIYVLEQMFKNQNKLQELNADELNEKLQKYRADYSEYLRENFGNLPYESEAEALGLLNGHLVGCSPKEQYEYDKAILDYAQSRENESTDKRNKIGDKKARLVREELTAEEFVQNGLKKKISDDNKLIANDKVQVLEKYFGEEPNVKDLFDAAVYAEIEKKTNAIQQEQNTLDAEAAEINTRINDLNRELSDFESNCEANGVNGVAFMFIRAAISKDNNILGDKENYVRAADFEQISLAADKYLKDKQKIINRFDEYDKQIDTYLQKKAALAEKRKTLSDYAETKLADVLQKRIDAEAKNELYAAGIRDLAPQLSQILKDDLADVCTNLAGLKAGLKTIARPQAVSAEAVLAEEALKAITKIEEGLRLGKDAQKLFFDDNNRPLKELTLLLKCREVFAVKDGYQLNVKEDCPDKKLFDELNQKAAALGPDAKNYLSTEILHLLYKSSLDFRQQYTGENAALGMDVIVALEDTFNELSTSADLESIYVPVIIGQTMQRPQLELLVDKGFGESFHSTQLFSHMQGIYDKENRRTGSSEAFNRYVKVLAALQQETERLYFEDQKLRPISREDIDKYELALQGYSKQLKDFLSEKGLSADEQGYVKENDWLIRTFIENDALLLETLQTQLAEGEKCTMSNLIGKHMQTSEGGNSVHSVTNFRTDVMKARMNALQDSGHRDSDLYRNVADALNNLIRHCNADAAADVMSTDCSNLSRACKNYIKERGKSEPSTKLGKNRLQFIKELYSLSSILKEGWDTEDLRRQLAQAMLTSAGKEATPAAINILMGTDLFKSMAVQKSRNDLRLLLSGEYSKEVLAFAGIEREAPQQPQAENPAAAGPAANDAENLIKNRIGAIDEIISSDVVRPAADGFGDFYHTTQLKMNLPQIIAKANEIQGQSPEFKKFIAKLEGVLQITNELYEKDGKIPVLKGKDIVKYNTYLEGLTTEIAGFEKLKGLTQAEKDFLPEVKKLNLYTVQDKFLMSDIAGEIGEDVGSLTNLISKHEERQAEQGGMFDEDQEETYVIPDNFAKDNSLQEKINIISAANDEAHPEYETCIEALNQLNEVTGMIYSKDADTELMRINKQGLQDYLQVYKTAFTALDKYSKVNTNQQLVPTLTQLKTKLKNESAVLGKIKLGQTSEQTLSSVMQNIKDSDYELKRLKGLKQDLINVDSMLHIDTSLYKAMDASLKTVISDLESGSDPKKLQADYASLLVNSRNYASERSKAPRKTNLEKGRFKAAKQLSELAAAFKEKLDIRIAEEKLAKKMLEVSGQAVFKEDHKTIDMDKKANIVSIRKIVRSDLFRVIVNNKTASDINMLADKTELWDEIFNQQQAQQNQPQQANPQNQAQADVQQNQPQADANQNQQEQVQQNALHN